MENWALGAVFVGVIAISPEIGFLLRGGAARGRRPIDPAAPPSGGDSPPPRFPVDRRPLCAASRGASVHRDASARSRPPPGCAGALKHRTVGYPCAQRC